jgi:transcriptional regulator with XRE-family HTH domain
MDGSPRRRARRRPTDPEFQFLEPFARRLENFRLECSLTQRVLAHQAGISTNHYQDIAHANANPSAVVLLKLASALGVTMSELFDPQLRDSDGRIV